MPIGLLFWLIAIITVLAAIFGSAYPFVSFGCILFLIVLLGWKAFGPPLQG